MNELACAIEASKKAGKIMLSHFNKNISYSDKGDFNIVSKADLDSEKVIIETLKKHYPSHSYYSEEAGHSKNQSENMWIIDPLDGTNNFAIGLPNFGTTIALIKKQVLTLGVSYQPMTGALMHAEKGKGVFLNGKKNVPSVEPEKQTVSFITGYAATREQFPLMLKLSGKVKRMISTWAPSIDYQLLASGKIDTIISINSEAVDQISGLIFAQEAGCIIRTFEGKAYVPKKFEEFTPNLIISRNMKTYKEILNLLELKV